MAKKGSTSSGNNAFSGYRFINVSLDKDDKAWLAANANIERYPLDALGVLVAQGFKVSFSEDAKNHSFVCSFTDTRSGSPTEKSILTGRGSTTLDAWFACCYKHFQIAREDWTQIADENEASGSRFG
jgi:hypothetical protein